jgi:hypothetical protein
LSEAEAWDADLIVVESHGRSGFDRVIMGSVSEAVALRANCSKEVIRQSKPVRRALKLYSTVPLLIVYHVILQIQSHASR